MKNIPVKIWLPWTRQVTWAVICHIELLPGKFWKKSPSLVAFALILKKLTSKVAAGRIRPPPGLNRVKLPINEVSSFTGEFNRYWSFIRRLALFRSFTVNYAS